MARTVGAKNIKRLSTEQKKLRGTYNVTKDREQEKQEKAVCEKTSLADISKFEIPKALKNAEVKDLYKSHIETLHKLNYLCEIDKSELDSAYFTLEKAKEIEKIIAALDPTDVESDEFDILLKRYETLFKRYTNIVERYLVSPQSRLRYVIDNLTIEEKKTNLAKNQNVMERLINGEV